MTTRAGHGYGARPMPARLPSLAVLAVLVSSSCTPIERDPAPLDRFTFPTGLAFANDHLVVVSSNYDLTYDDSKGGSVLSVDPEGSLAGALQAAGAVRTPSFGGELAIADAEECGLSSGIDLAVVPNRLTSEVFRLEMGVDGSLTCGEGCRADLGDPGEGDPFTVDVVCRAGRAPAAYVGWLRARTGDACSASGGTCATISEVRLDDLTAAPSSSTVLTGVGGIRKISYDPRSGLLLFVTTGAMLGWIDLSGGCDFGSDENPCTVQAVELGPAVEGLETRSVAASSAETSRRLYVIGQVYDPARAAAGIRYDVGGVMMVLSLEPARLGGYTASLVRLVSLGTGASGVQVIPRAGQRDLVAITLTGDGEVLLWDDEIGAVTGVIGSGPDGVPLVGEQPYGLAAHDLGTGDRPVRLYVGSFADGVISVVELDPTAPSPVATWRDPAPVQAASGALVRGRIGG